MKDKAGKELSPFDIIVYGHNKGRCAGLRFGVVLGAKQSDSWRGPREYLSIVGIDDDYGHCKATKKTALKFGERTLLVGRDQLPANVLAVADQVRKENGFVPACTCEAWYCGHARECPQYKENP